MNSKTIIIDNLDSITENYYKSKGIEPLLIWKNNHYSERKYKILRFFNLQHLCYGFTRKDIMSAKRIILCEPRNCCDIVKFIKKYNKNVQVVIWTWNIIDHDSINDIKKAKKNDLKIYSFDKDDCLKYGIKYNFNLLPVFKIKEFSEIKGCFFCGQDKNRFSALENLGKQIIETGNTINILIVKDRHIKYPSKSIIKLLSNNIPYAEILNNISQAKCLIDIVQDGQIGLTYRPLEALFYNKKLITNNKAIKSYDFYKEENIYILGEDKRTLKEFIESDFVHWNEKIVKKYTIENWINNFFE